MSDPGERLAGWYPGDNDPSKNRYWNGAQWLIADPAGGPASGVDRLVDDERLVGWFPGDNDPSKKYWNGAQWLIADPPAGPASGVDRLVDVDSAGSRGRAATVSNWITPGRRLAAALVGCLLLVVAAALAFTPINAEGMDCGSVISKKNYEVRPTDVGDIFRGITAEAACSSLRSGRTTIVGVTAALGVVLLIGSATYGRSSRTRRGGGVLRSPASSGN